MYAQLMEIVFKVNEVVVRSGALYGSFRRRYKAHEGCTVGGAARERKRVSKANRESPGVRGLFESGKRARKWLIGLVLAGVAAVITSYVASGIRSGVDHANSLVKHQPSPVVATVTRSANKGAGHWYFAGPASAVKAIPLPTGNLASLETWDAWARAHGGVDADMTAVQVVLEGATPYPVILTGLTVDVIHRAAPSRKGVHYMVTGGGPVGVRYFEVILDKRPPTVRSIPAEFKPRKPAIDFPYKVSETDPEVLDIRAYALKCDCTWRANLQWIYHGKHGSTVIDDDGRPFRTVAGPSAIQYFPKFDAGSGSVGNS